MYVGTYLSRYLWGAGAAVEPRPRPESFLPMYAAATVVRLTGWGAACWLAGYTHFHLAEFISKKTHTLGKNQNNE